MKYEQTTKSHIPLEDHHILYDIDETETTITYFIKSQKHICSCPHCAHQSDEQVSTYSRIVQDIPQYLKRVNINYIVSRYKCPNCDRIFSEALRDVKPYQVRTKRFTNFILGLSIYLSDYNTSRTLKIFGAEISHDTVKRIIENVRFTEETKIIAVGIDDIALRKGKTYVTVIYDLIDGHLIAILKGRDQQSVETWLKEHPEIRLVTRDRSRAYAAAISAALPEAIQVTDRFHLLQNIKTHLKEIFYEEVPKTLELNKIGLKEKEKVKTETISPDSPEVCNLHYDSSPPVDENGEVIHFNDTLMKIERVDKNSL